MGALGTILQGNQESTMVLMDILLQQQQQQQKCTVSKSMIPILINELFLTTHKHLKLQIKTVS